MKQEWLEYLRLISLPERLCSIVENKIKEVQSIFDVECSIIFVSNRLTEQGVSFMSLWLFSDDKAYECKEFLSSDDYDTVYTRKNVVYVNIKKTNYPNLESTQENSNLSGTCYLGTANLSCSFNAVGENCIYLLNLLKSEYISNVKTI